MTTKPILYSYFRSSCSWRVRIVLEWKGIEYEYKATHLLEDGGHQNSEIYKAINPMAQVPALVLNGNTCLSQSIAIIEYLEEAYPEKPLMPKDTLMRFQVREICEIIGSGIQPMQNLSVLKQFEAEKQKAWGAQWNVKGLTALETKLKGRSGKYCVGDEVTLADCCLVPQLYHARRFEVNMEAFPTLLEIEANLAKLEPFYKAHADRQPDSPPL